MVVVAGDLTGKMIIPIVREGDRTVSRVFGEEHLLAADEVEEHEKMIAELGDHPDEVDRIFRRLVRE